MRIRGGRRAAAFLCLTAVFCMLLSTVTPAQLPQCGYDRKSPSLIHARESFKSLNYVCAELELRDLLIQEDLNLMTKADAHVLMAAVYYAMFQDKDEKRAKTRDQFKEAFRTYRDWKGELDIDSEDFQSLMREARLQVEDETRPAPPDTAVTPAAPVTTNEYFQGRADGERDAKASGMWFFAGFCFGAIGVAIAYLTAPSPSTGVLVGKSRIYINAYTEGYKSKCSSMQGKKALYGWGAACIVTAVVYVIVAVILVEESDDTSSSWGKAGVLP